MYLSNICDCNFISFHGVSFVSIESYESKAQQSLLSRDISSIGFKETVSSSPPFYAVLEKIHNNIHPLREIQTCVFFHVPCEYFFPITSRYTNEEIRNASYLEVQAMHKIYVERAIDLQSIY